MNLKNNRGFTLIELMIVVAIIGILAASAIPKFADIVNKAKEASAKGNLSAIRSALSIYYAEQMYWANDLDGIVPDNLSRLPAAAIPTANTEWDTDFDVDPSFLEANGNVLSNYGDSEVSVNGGPDGESGWAYHPSEENSWVETSVLDANGNAVHAW